MTEKLQPSDLQPASYNPRKMEASAKEALKKSMEEFEDISGITWNKRTKNIVTGHHRWDNLIEYFGQDSLSFKKLTDSRYSILANGEDTDFVLRVVDWDEDKEKAANVAGNSKTLMGEFTVDLDNVLEDIKVSFGHVYNDLHFDELKFSVDDVTFETEKIPVKEHEREPRDLSDRNKEIDVDSFGNDLDHKCPKCGFEFND